MPVSKRRQANEDRPKKHDCPSYALLKVTDEDLRHCVVQARDRTGPAWLDDPAQVAKAEHIADWYQRCPYNPETRKGIQVAEYPTLLGVSWHFVREVFAEYNLGPFPEEAVPQADRRLSDAYGGFLAPRAVPTASDRYR